jgi:hypothetical protein
MGQEVITPKGKEIKVSMNPYASLSKEELKDVIVKNKNEIVILDQRAFSECAERVMSRNNEYLESIYEIRDSILSVKRQAEQIEEVVLGRIEAMPTASKKILKEWRDLHTSCTIVDKIGARSFERTAQTINDYRYAFPNEKSSSLKKLVQIGAITTFVTNIAGFFFGDSLKSKGIAAGGAIATALLINRVESAQNKANTQRLPRRTGLKPYKIRQAYGYLS